MKRNNRDWLVWVYCFLVAGVCLLICSKSSPLYPINDWTDANAYLSCGKGMLNGRVMYRDLYEHKGPLLYALHALCALVDGSSFLGVFLLEVVAGGLFLTAAYKLMTLYGARRSAVVMVPLVAAVVYTSFSFQQGDSAEELCLPMLAWSLYSLLRWLRTDAPQRMRASLLLINGVLCGCVLWMKFTILGLYVPWILGMMLYHFSRREAKAALSAFGWFVVGIAVATLPWVLYFGLNGAILPWLKTYLYDNLFLYQDEPALGLGARVKAMLRAGWEWFRLNPAYSLPLAVGLGWFTLIHGTKRLPRKDATNNAATPRDAQGKANRLQHDSIGATVAKSKPDGAISGIEKAFVWGMVLLMALGVFIGGKSYVYYGFVLAVFTVLGALPLCRLLDGVLPQSATLWSVLACLSIAGAIALCLFTSPNRGDLLKPRAETMQYRFAAIVNQTPDATLLNYGFMDAGFYTACGIAPTVKYFHQTNVHLQEMLDEQARYVADGVTDYVVTRGRQPDSILTHYELVATADAPANFWYKQVYLYRRIGLDN